MRIYLRSSGTVLNAPDFSSGSDSSLEIVHKFSYRLISDVQRVECIRKCCCSAVIGDECARDLSNRIQSLVGMFDHTLGAVGNYEAYRRHWRSLKSYLGTGGSKTRVLRVLALLVESGGAYCSILVSTLRIRIEQVTDTLECGCVGFHPRIPVEPRKCKNFQQRRILFCIRVSGADCGKYFVRHSKTGNILYI